MKPFWDNNETTNYKWQDGYWIYDTHGAKIEKDVIRQLNCFKKIDAKLRKDLANSTDYGVQLYLRTPMVIRELDPLIMEYKGLNKPKDRYISDDIPWGPDGRVRAAWKMLFLKIRSKGGKALFHDGNPDYMNRLFLHELAHTMANSVVYTPNDKVIHNRLWNQYRLMLYKWGQENGLIGKGMYDV